MQQVESGSMFKRDSVDCDPVLQMADVSTMFCKFALISSECAHKQVILQASDKNAHCIGIKIASQLNDVSGNLKTGVFIKLQQCRVLKCLCEIYFHAYSVMLCISLKNHWFQ